MGIQGFDGNSRGPDVVRGRSHRFVPILGVRLGGGQLGPADDGPSKPCGGGSRSRPQWTQVVNCSIYWE